MTGTLHVAVLEPYYGGSHAAFVDTIKLLSRHRITLVTLPARKWKWRMRGAAIWFARDEGGWTRGGDGRAIDVILCNDMLSVADLRALLPQPLRSLPIVCYFHENQLTYPLPGDQQRDFQYGMTNITSCLAADAVWFNSRFHARDFLAAVRRLLGKMPDYVPGSVVQEIDEKTDVLPPPVLAHRVDRTGAPPAPPLTILWCHRWEDDKNPEPFFKALVELDEAGGQFNLVLVGETFRTAPPVFAQACKRLASHITHAGFISSRDDYLSMLSRCDVVVSTAIQENFGIAVVEAILCGCQPLLPDRLAYPELIPPKLQDTCLYPSDAMLFGALRDVLDGRRRLTEPQRTELQASVEGRFGAQTAVLRLDEALVDLVNRQ